MNAREKAIFIGGGVTWWALQNPVKRGKFIFRAANLVRFGTATTSVGLGTAAMYGGAVAVGAVVGGAALVGGTYTAEHFGIVPEGSTDYAMDFVSGNVDDWYDYIPVYNISKIVKSKF